MCLGEQAKNANEAARRNYEYQLAQRKANWMQTLSITNTERIQYEQGLQASNLGLSQVYGEIQEKFGDAVGDAFQADEENWRHFLQNSMSSKLQASGQTGRSAERISALDLAEYLTKGSRAAYELTEAQEDMSKVAAQAAGQARAEQLNMFAQNAIIKSPDFAPPAPVYQNVGFAAFKDALSIAESVATIATGIPNIQKMFKQGGKSLSGLGQIKTGSPIKSFVSPGQAVYNPISNVPNLKIL